MGTRTLYAAMRAADAADTAWNDSLARSFGPADARTRRFDADDTHHPEECRTLRRKFFAAMLAEDSAGGSARAHLVSATETVQ